MGLQDGRNPVGEECGRGGLSGIPVASPEVAATPTAPSSDRRSLNPWGAPTPFVVELAPPGSVVSSAWSRAPDFRDRGASRTRRRYGP